MIFFQSGKLFSEEKPTSLQEPLVEEAPSKEPTRFIDRLRLSKVSNSTAENQLKTIYDDGFYLIGEDDSLRIGGWAQLDYRAFFGEHSSKDTFFVRRARLDVRGILEDDFSYRLYGAFEGSRARLHEAWIEYRKWSEMRIRIGQFKEPYSLEALYSAKWTHFIERSLGPTNLAPFEDIGVQCFGLLYHKKFTYAIATFNGEGRNELDVNNSKDIAARFVIQPFRNYPCSYFHDLHLGVSGTTGRHDGEIEDIMYKTAGRTTFFEYSKGVEQKGNLLRGGLEFDWLIGPFQMSGEYLVLRRNGVRFDDVSQDIESRSWYVWMGYLLTGEDQIRNDPIKPYHNFEPCKRGWGAWEIAVRYEEFETGRNAFESELATGVRNVRAITGGINWWPNIHVRFMLDFVHSTFSNKLEISDEIFHNENLLLFRAQYEF